VIALQEHPGACPEPHDVRIKLGVRGSPFGVLNAVENFQSVSESFAKCFNQGHVAFPMMPAQSSAQAYRKIFLESLKTEGSWAS
jgi:hypothetical protein